MIRLLVAMTIKHPLSYYDDKMKAIGIDPKELSHEQLSAYRSTMRVMEADLLIEAAYKQEQIELDDVDMKFLQDDK